MWSGDVIGALDSLGVADRHWNWSCRVHLERRMAHAWPAACRSSLLRSPTTVPLLPGHCRAETRDYKQTEQM
jgi:hypothetical protein